MTSPNTHSKEEQTFPSLLFIDGLGCFLIACVRDSGSVFSRVLYFAGCSAVPQALLVSIRGSILQSLPLHKDKNRSRMTTPRWSCLGPLKCFYYCQGERKRLGPCSFFKGQVYLKEVQHLLICNVLCVFSSGAFKEISSKNVQI